MKVYSGNMLWKMRLVVSFISLLLSANEVVSTAVQSTTTPTIFGICTCCATNQYRRNSGVDPLGYSVKLQGASVDQSDYQSYIKQMTHSNSAYNDFMNRIGATSGSDTFMEAAENVAQLLEEDAALAQAYKVAADMWYKSPGHRENMLNPKYAVCSACLTDVYATQDFVDKIEDSFSLSDDYCSTWCSPTQRINANHPGAPNGQSPQTPPTQAPNAPANPPQRSPSFGGNAGYGNSPYGGYGTGSAPPATQPGSPGDSNGQSPQAPPTRPPYAPVNPPQGSPYFWGNAGYGNSPYQGSGAGSAPPAAQPGGTAPNNDCNGYFAAINSARAARGLPILSYNPTLVAFAKQQVAFLRSGQIPDVSNIFAIVSKMLSPVRVGKAVAFYATNVADANAAIQFLRSQQSAYLYDGGVSEMGVGVSGQSVYIVYAKV